jgi:hypothetical protein
MVDEKKLGEAIVRNAQYVWPAAVAFCDYFIFANSMILVAVTAIMLAALFFLRRWDWKVLASYGVLLILLGLFQQEALGSRFAEYGYWFLASGIMAAIAGNWRDVHAGSMAQKRSRPGGSRI